MTEYTTHMTDLSSAPTPTQSPAHSPGGAAFTELVLEVFRLNGNLLTLGDRMTRDLGLTSARWQVLGALADGPATVSQIARAMGLSRQSVQRIVDVLAGEGLLVLKDNPNHRRARLADFTDRGRAALDAVTARQVVWANAVAAAIPPADLVTARDTVRALCRHLESNAAPEFARENTHVQSR